MVGVGIVFYTVLKIKGAGVRRGGGGGSTDPHEKVVFTTPSGPQRP